MHENFAEILKPNSTDAKLLAAIDLERLPQHIAVIMDGNGRWAKKRGKPRIFGHRAGSESVKAIDRTMYRRKPFAVIRSSSKFADARGSHCDVIAQSKTVRTRESPSECADANAVQSCSPSISRAA